jgi:hypothetical protein
MIPLIARAPWVDRQLRDLRRQELQRRHEVAAPVLEGHVIRSGIRVNDVETVRLEI